MPESAIVLRAVGDVTLRGDDPANVLELVQPVLRSADITFGNCESSYSERGSRNPAVRGENCGHPDAVRALNRVGFDVMTYANNHHIDAGYDAFFDTLQLLRDSGIATCGAGEDIAAARKPAIVERDGTRVAFLGYSSILMPGFEAGPNRPGCAPIAVYTHYQQVEYEQPGSKPRIFTFADPDHVEALRQDVSRAKEHADIVVFSPHWGIHFTPAVVADYETQVARAAIDAGADIVLGHHQHILKGVQVYKGKVIFHGMGNFASNFVAGRFLAEDSSNPAFREMQEQYPEHGLLYDPDYPSYPYRPEARNTLIVQCDIVDKSIRQVSFLPTLVNRHGQPEPLTAGDDRFADVRKYVKDISAAVGFDTHFEDQENQVVIAV
jgi:poly-gamma-glutamate capsule biosynthesis protein CapA/YwtB (metallophosphatase superfamily)